VVDGRYIIKSKDTTGFSTTYKVVDAAGREWNVKIGPEAQTEVVTSRIVWALGYHELPSYFVERWIAVEDSKGAQLGGARFRPHDLPLEPRGTWSWHQNPFVDTRPYNGLLVLMMILNSSDLKDDNNSIYELKEPWAGMPDVRRWFVVRDLGAALGETGKLYPRRNWIDGFEKEAFITGVEGRQIRFAYTGRHQELLRMVTAADLRWAATRLQRLTERQWHDAFRAANYTDEVRDRYLRKIREKIAQALEASATAQGSDGV
jgi:hypothetical protein